MRFADAFGTEHPGVCDEDFILWCTCGLEQRLDATLVEELRELTLYDCSRCENTVAAIVTENAAEQLFLSSGAMARRSQASGIARNGYVVATRVDVALRPPDADEDVELVLCSPDFFDALRNI